ncbi:MAG: hypothetical protein AAGC77_10385 [Pseudomonadota bacterium]
MALAMEKSAEDRKPAKRSPLAGWFGKRRNGDADDELPPLDITGGLNRALRQSPSSDEFASPAAEQEKSVRAALSVIEAALYAIDQIRETLEQACEVAISAKCVDEVGGRALLAERYDELRLSVNASLENAEPRAAVLIGKNQRHLDVSLGGKARYSVSPARLDVGAKGLQLSPPRDAFATYDEVDVALDELDRALARADQAAANYCRDAQYLIARMNGVNAA